MTQLFVYGTLKRGCRNHHFMRGQTYVREAMTTPRFRLYDLGGYPGMVSDENGNAIQGEIWDVSDECLAALDVLEDIEGGEYAMEFIALAPPNDGEPMRTYLYKRSVIGCPSAGTRWEE